MTHTFCGKRYRLKNQRPYKAWADCDSPTAKNKTIRAPLEGDTEGDLADILHESLHAGVWALDEDTVDALANDIARLLWRLKWRKEL